VDAVRVIVDSLRDAESDPLHPCMLIDMRKRVQYALFESPLQFLVVSLDSVDEGATKNRWSLADRADRESQEAPDSSTTPP